MFNKTCPADPATSTYTAQHVAGDWTFQRLILVISGVATAVTLLITLFTISTHVFHYTIPKEQRQIIRIVFTPFIFAILSFISTIQYSISLYALEFRDMYESFAIASLFILYVSYLCKDEGMQEEYFSNSTGGGFKGFKTAWMIVLLYPVVQTILTIAQVATVAAGTYCEMSNSPHFAHLWIRILTSFAVVIVVMRILRFYRQHKSELTPHRALPKLISFKLIVFVNFVQSLVFSFLTKKLHQSGNGKVTPSDLAIGIPALLVCVEQMFFACGLLFAYSAKYYKSGSTRSAEQGPRMNPIMACFDAMNPLDLIQGIARAIQILLSSRQKSSGGYSAGGEGMGVDQSPSGYNYKPENGQEGYGRPPRRQRGRGRRERNRY